MHKTRTTFIGQVAKLVAEFLRHKVEAGRDTVAQTVSTQPENVAKVTVKLLGRRHHPRLGVQLHHRRRPVLPAGRR